MSNVKIKANTSGSADFTIEAPATDSALTLTLPSVDGELLTTNGDASGLQNIESAFNTQIGGRRNLIINGGFDVWQRGTSFTGATYTADRWIISTTESGTAVTKTANRDKRNTLRVTFGSTISANLDQRIEAFGNVGYNKEVTLSFYVRGSRATTADFCRIRNHTTSTTLETLTYDITTSWTKVTKTFSADNTWSKDDVARLYVFANGGSSPWASGDWVEFSDVQLEVGSVATPFEHRSYGEELALCKRYYEVIRHYTAETDTYYAGRRYLDGHNFMVQKRATPSATVTGLYAWSSGIGSSNLIVDSVSDYMTAVTDVNSANTLYSYEIRADAEL